MTNETNATIRARAVIDIARRVAAESAQEHAEMFAYAAGRKCGAANREQAYAAADSYILQVRTNRDFPGIIIWCLVQVAFVSGALASMGRAV